MQIGYMLSLKAKKTYSGISTTWNGAAVCRMAPTSVSVLGSSD